jgi:hypothetical protein
VAALSVLVLVAVREFQSYVVNPHLMGHSVGLSPLVTLVSVSVVSILFGGFAVVLAVPFTSAVATLIDVFVLDREPPAEPAQRGRTQPIGDIADASVPRPDDERMVADAFVGSQIATRELDVVLLWRRGSRQLWVEVTHRPSGRVARLDAPPAQALDVFNHPFAYAPLAA